MMRFSICAAIVFIFIHSPVFSQENSFSDNDKYVLVIHGGAGTLLPGKMSAEKERAYRDKLTEALSAGYEKIKNGGQSLDAVTAAITVMEDSPLFNAGKGAVMTHEGKNELDASIMDGATQDAGAVAGITTVKNTILAARSVMEQSVHVMFSRLEAEHFAESQGLEIVAPVYFWTERRWENLQRVLEKDSAQVELDHDEKQTFSPPVVDNIDDKFGTVG